MEIVYFTIVAIILYIVADRLLDRIEIAAGKRLENRSLIFFAMYVKGNVETVRESRTP